MAMVQNRRNWKAHRIPLGASLCLALMLVLPRQASPTKKEILGWVEHVRVGSIFDHSWYAFKAEQAAGAPASLTSHQLIAFALAAHHNRLHQALLADRIREALEPLVVKVVARLPGGGIDGLDVQVHQAAGRFRGLGLRIGCGRRGIGRLARRFARDQRVKAASQSTPRSWS